MRAHDSRHARSGGATSQPQPAADGEIVHVDPPSLEKIFEKIGALKEVLVCTIAGSKREALVYGPSVGTKHPLVFAWHGHGDDYWTAASDMHFHVLWPEAIVVYPQGLPTPTGNHPEAMASPSR